MPVLQRSGRAWTMLKIAVAAGIFAVLSAHPAEAKRRWSVNSSAKTAPAVAEPTRPPVSMPAAPVAGPRPAAPVSARPTGLFFFGATPAAAAPAQQDQRALPGTAPSPAPRLAPTPIVNPNARRLPVLGSDPGDPRPVPGFVSLN